MKTLGVDDAAIEQAEWEVQSENARFFDAKTIVITSNWVVDRSVTRPALFPLEAITSFRKDYSRRRHGSSFYVELEFSNGATHKLRCIFEQLDAIVALLAERCPQAKH